MKSEVIDLIVTVNGESIDGHIFPEFQTTVGCENFVGNLVEGRFGKFLFNHSLFLINKERVIGFCFVTEHNDTVGFIPIMGLLPDFRGKGLGKSILLSVISKMKMESPQFEKLGLTVTEENYPAYSMYKKYGFKHLETNHVYTKTI
ncbi:MAG: GNAT family N-acetyltransferase [Candidatus Heimdallarchaeota archaeon]|nr:GNAT family N-acetyltransferase [Candidatus Heimdallarchaeota archaeon]